MAGNRVISAVLSLKDKDFGSGVKKATGGTKDFERRVKHTSNQVKKFGKSAVSSFSNVAKGAIGLAAAFVGFRKLGSFMGESVEAAKALIEIETKLESVMKNTKGVTDKQIQSVKHYSDELSNAGVVGGDVIISGVQQMSSYKLQTASLKKLMPGMDNLLVRQKGLSATQEDAAAIGTMFGKVMSGQTSALSKAGIKFTKSQEQIFKFGTESQKASLLAEVLEKSVGGVSAAMAETDQGKIQQMTNSWAVYKEEVGKKILPLQAKFAGWFSKHIPGIQGLVLGAMDKGVVAFQKAEKVVVKVFTKIKEVIKSNKPVIDTIKNGVEAFGTGVLVVKDWAVGAFQNIKKRIRENSPALEGVKSVMQDMGEKALELKDWMISAFDSAKPALTWLKDDGLPMVVDGIVAVIEKATDIYNYINDNWSAISPVVYGVAGAILFYKTATTAVSIATTIWSGVTWAMTAAQGAFNTVMAISPLGWVAIAIGAVVTAGVLLYKNWDTVKATAQSLWDKTKEVGAGIQDAFSGAFNAVKKAAGDSMNFVIDKINGLISAINKVPGVKIPVVAQVDWVQAKAPQGVAGLKGLDSYDVGTNRVKRDMVANIHKDEMIVPAAQSKNLRKQGVTIDNIDIGSPKGSTATDGTQVKAGPSIIIENFNAKGITAAEVLNELIPMLKLRLANL